MRLLLFLLVAAICIASGPAKAQPSSSSNDAADGFLSAGDLFAKCREPSVEAVSFCFAYVAGVADTARAYQAWLETNDFCIPEATPQSALIDTFERHLAAHPTLSTSQAGSAVILALQEGYACTSSVIEGVGELGVESSGGTNSINDPNPE